MAKSERGCQDILYKRKHKINMDTKPSSSQTTEGIMTSATPHADSIMSHVDGPTDFTEEILFHLFPEDHVIRTAKQPNVTEPGTLEDGAQKRDMEEYISSDPSFSSSPDARNSPSHLNMTNERRNREEPISHHAEEVPSPSPSPRTRPHDPIEELDVSSLIDAEEHAQLVQHQRESQAMIEKLQDKLALSEDRFADLQDRMAELTAEMNAMRASYSAELRKQKESSLKDHASTKQRYDASLRKSAELLAKEREETKRLRGELAIKDKSIPKASELRESEELLSKERAETKRLRGELAKTDSATFELQDLRNELLVANDRSEDVQRERDEMHKKLTTVCASLERHIKSEREAKKVSVEVKQRNKQIHHQLKTRTNDWSEEKKQLLSDIEQREKLLMVEWGRMECGPSAHGEPQPFKFKYVGVKE